MVRFSLYEYIHAFVWVSNMERTLRTSFYKQSPQNRDFLYTNYIYTNVTFGEPSLTSRRIIYICFAFYIIPHSHRGDIYLQNAHLHWLTSPTTHPDSVTQATEFTKTDTEETTHLLCRTLRIIITLTHTNQIEHFFFNAHSIQALFSRLYIYI